MTKKKEPEEKLKVGRPSNYNPEIAKRICNVVATNTVGYRRLERIYDFLPIESVVREWRLIYPEFGLQYAQAKMIQAELLAEECLDIADDSRNDWMDSLDEDGKSYGWKINGDHINRCRLRIDTRKFFASKLLPKKYGDAKVQEPINTEVDEDCKKRYREMDERNKKDF